MAKNKPVVIKAVLKVVYKPGTVTPKDAKELVRAAIERAVVYRASITGNGPAEVDDWRVSVSHAKGVRRGAR